jgi:hypothetical protein
MDQQLTRPQQMHFFATSTTPVIGCSAGPTRALETGAPETGDRFAGTLTENVAAPILADLPAVDRTGYRSLTVGQDGTGERSPTGSGALEWPRGAPAAISSAASAVDVDSLVTRDGGATWYGFPGAQDFS